MKFESKQEEAPMKIATIPMFLAVTVALILSSCANGPNFSLHKLPSGRVVKIAGVMKIAFSEGDSALMLKYFTDVSLTNTVALQDEATDIWQDFRSEVEKAGLKAAVLSANTMPHGIISQTSGFNFVYQKQPNGEWSALEHKPKSPSNTTAQ